MGLRTLNLQLIAGEVPNLVEESRFTRFLKRIEGFDITAPLGAERNALVTADGSDMLNYLPLQRAPLEGARGNFDPETQTWTNEEDDSAENYDVNIYSSPGTSSVVVLSFPGIEGNVVAIVNNGNGMHPLGLFSGTQGVVSSVAQELWGGEDVPIATSTQITSNNDGYYG